VNPAVWSAFVKEASALGWALQHPLHMMGGAAAAFVGSKALKKNYQAAASQMPSPFETQQSLPRTKRPNPLYGPSSTGIY
jgi:hypothetical protein